MASWYPPVRLDLSRVIVVQNNEILAFDTDLVGSYGIWVDISQTWWIGDQKPSPNMFSAMQHTHEYNMQNMQMLKPVVMMPELTMNAHNLAPEYQKSKYS